MANWITVYKQKGNKIKEDIGRLNSEQKKELTEMFRGVSMGLESEFVQDLMAAHRNKNWFRHINPVTGMRYEIDVDKRRNIVKILAVDAEFSTLSKNLRNGLAA